MKLRYTVEGKFSATFTTCIKVKDEEQALTKIISMRGANFKEGYYKYSNFILYDDDNNLIKRLN